MRGEHHTNAILQRLALRLVDGHGKAWLQRKLNGMSSLATVLARGISTSELAILPQCTHNEGWRACVARVNHPLHDHPCAVEHTEVWQVLRRHHWHGMLSSCILTHSWCALPSGASFIPYKGLRANSREPISQSGSSSSHCVSRSLSTSLPSTRPTVSASSQS